MAYTTIDDPSAYFKCHLYTGTGSTNAQTFADTDTNMQPDMVWIKSRSDEFSHMLYDAARGVQKHLKPDSTAAEATDANSLTTFGSDGFTVGTNTDLNNSSDTYVAWCWKMGTTSGISGTGNLTVNAYSFNSTAKQSVIVYTGNGGSSGTYTHGLGSAPGFIFGKNRDEAGDNWFAYHHKNTSAPETDYLAINTTSATADSADYWNDVAPTSTLVTVGGGGEVNRAEQQVAYCFAEVQGYSKFGSYIGNGNADGTFVYTGFRPAMVFVKNTANASTNWYLYDDQRLGYNVDNNAIYPNTTAGDQTDDDIDILSNGFKPRNTDAGHNESGNTIIYAAWAKAPFVNSNGVPCNAR